MDQNLTKIDQNELNIFFDMQNILEIIKKSFIQE